MFHPIIFKVKIDAFGYICGNFNDAWCMISHFRNQSKSCSVRITDCPRGRSEEPIFQQRRMLFVQVNFFPNKGISTSPGTEGVLLLSVVSAHAVWKDFMWISELEDVPSRTLLQESDSSTVRNLITGSRCKYLTNPTAKRSLLY